MKYKYALNFIIALCLIFTVQTVCAQWQTNGPWGGAVTALRTKGALIFSGTMKNGVFKSADGGINWTAANAGLEGVWITDLTSNSAGLFAGTNEKGIYFSSDDGASWTPRNTGLAGLYITSLFSTGNLLFAGTPDGIYFSNSNGTTWSLRNSGIPLTYDIYDWAVMGDTIYAATYGEGLFRSANNGQNWTQVAVGFPVPAPFTSFYVYSLATSGNTIYAGISMGFYRSFDRGLSWSNSGNMYMQTTYAVELAVLNSTLFAGTYPDGVFRSTDDGATWISSSFGMQAYPGFQTYLQTVDFAEGPSNSILAASLFGLYRSTDNGLSWTDSNTGILATEIIGLAASPAAVFAGDAYTGMYVTVDKGLTWQRANNGLAGNYIAAAVTKKNTAFVSVDYDKVYKSTDNGKSWQYASYGLPRPAAILEADSNRVVAISSAAKYEPNRVFQTNDNGSNWTEIPSAPISGAMSALAVRGLYVYVGTSEGALYRTQDNGASWQDISYYLPVTRITSILALDTVTYVGTAGKGIFMFLKNDSYMRPSYVGLTNYNITDLILQNSVLFAGTKGAGVFVSPNAGNSWMPFNEGLKNKFINQLAGQTEKVYAGTNAGVYQTDENAFKTIGILAGIPENPVATQISFFPNPTKGKLQIKTSTDETCKAELLTLTGLTLDEITFKKDATLDLQIYPVGLYFVKITTEKGILTKRITFEK